MEVVLDDAEELRLNCVLSVYSTDSSKDAKAIIVRHQVDYSGRVSGKGEPIDGEAVLWMLKHSASGSRQAGTGFIPAFSRLLFEDQAWRVWHSPAQRRKLFIAGVPQLCWLPPMLWCGSKSRPTLYLWSHNDKRPGMKTICYRPRYGPTDGLNHIHDNSQVCNGSMNPGSMFPADWEAAFYDSNFKTKDGLPSKPYKIHERHKRLGTLEQQLGKIA